MIGQIGTPAGLPNWASSSVSGCSSINTKSRLGEGRRISEYFFQLPSWKKYSEIRRPSPSRLFVFIDEHPDTLLDAQFGNPAGVPIWPIMWFDMPADRHNQGACLSFADGHAERWRWKVPKVFQFLGQSPTAEEMPDYQRVQSAMKLVTDN